MAILKTKPTKVGVKSFLNKVEPKEKRHDSFELMEMMKDITKETPKMWGPSIVGFGKYHYKYASGHEGDMCIAAFSPRKAAITIYLYPVFSNYKDLLKKLGKHKTSVGCLYIKKLSDIDINILRKMVERSIKLVKENYPD